MEELQELKLELSKLSLKDLQNLKRQLHVKCNSKSKQSIIEGILDAISNYEISIDEVQERLKEVQEKKSTRSARLDTLLETIREEFKLWKKDLEMAIKSLYEEVNRLNSRIESLESQINELKKALDFGEMDYVSELKKLERSLKEIDPRLNEIGDYIATLRRLEVFGIDIRTLSKLGLLLIISDELSRLAKVLHPEKTLERFYNIVKEEAQNFTEPDGTIVIYKVRESVCAKLGISRDEFDRLLGECFERGWLTLDFRSPISGAKEEDFAEIDGRKYYIIRSFRK